VQEGAQALHEHENGEGEDPEHEEDDESGDGGEGDAVNSKGLGENHVPQDLG
jgi:hypothetical protein